MRILYAFVILTFLGMSAQAQQVQIDLSKLSADRAAEVLQAQKEATTSSVPAVQVPTVDQARQWAGIGEEVAGAIAAAAKALSISVNDFMTTPVGWWTFVFIFWYLLGHKLWAIAGGSLVWLILGSVIWRSYRIFHMRNRVLLKEDGKVKTYDYQTYQFASGDGRSWSAVCHAVAFIVLCIVMLVIIFG